MPRPFGVLRNTAVVDAAFALLFTVAVVLITSRLNVEPGEFRRLDALGYAAIVIAGGALAWRRRAPRTILAITVSAIIVYAVRGYTGGPVYLADVVAMYTVATTSTRREWLVAGGAAWAALVAATAVLGDNASGILHYLLYGSWLLAAGFFGDAARSRREYLQGLEARNRQLLETQAEEARRQLAEERLRIARDVHDVVAHSLASINIQAGAGLHVADRHPEQAVDALAAIKHASSDALRELRTTLDLLRTGGDDGTAGSAAPAPRAPQPSVRRLDALVARAEQAGLHVDVTVHGTPTLLPQAVDAAAYRIVQEALTNTMRHAGASRAWVSLAYSPADLAIEVCDDGRGGEKPVGRAAGHGIAGMRERASELGGSVVAAARPEGGFRVRARLPTNGVVA
jgi:signal transduction histidine kinase